VADFSWRHRYGRQGHAFAGQSTFENVRDVGLGVVGLGLEEALLVHRRDAFPASLGRPRLISLMVVRLDPRGVSRHPARFPRRLPASPQSTQGSLKNRPTTPIQNFGCQLSLCFEFDQSLTRSRGRPEVTRSKIRCEGGCRARRVGRLWVLGWGFLFLASDGGSKCLSHRQRRDAGLWLPDHRWDASRRAWRQERRTRTRNRRRRKRRSD
jgi:hypothetical protein